MTLKSVVGQKIMNEVIKRKTTNVNTNKHIDWRVLVVDHFAMRMISACCKIHEISNEGITIVEDLLKNREPLISLEAIYFITPCVKSVLALIEDFSKPENPKYKAAHIYFTEECPDELFNNLRSSPAKKFIKTLKEINLAFVAYEQQVFSLDSPETFQCYFNPSLVNSSVSNLERTAEQIVTVCAALGEYPSIRYRKDYKTNVILANMVKQKLDAYKADDPTMGKGPEKVQSQLIILDRGFDCVSPVLHELTLQAMAYDLLPIENDIYKYKASTSTGVKEVLLDENDETWVELRHEHIGVVSKKVTNNLKKFTDSKRMFIGDNKNSLRDLSTVMKKMPQYQKELSKYCTHLNLAEDCMKYYEDNVKNLYEAEQDLAMGTDIQDEKIKDHMMRIIPVLLEQKTSRKDKIRIIILYILSKNGTTEENLDKLIKHAQLSPEDKKCIVNLSLLGINIIVNRNQTHQYQLPRKEHEHACSISRWTPVINDLMEYCIEDKLDIKHFPFLSTRDSLIGSITESNYAKSARFPRHWGKERMQQKNVPRLIVFVVGGVCYSEMRCAYEVTKKFKNWEVIIGSSHILTPNGFLDDLSALWIE